MKEAQDDAERLRVHMLHSYVSSRVGIAVIGGILPFLVSIPVGFRQRTLLGSISEYYYSFMGDVFVGVLIAVGVALYLYKGYGTRENYALNAAGIFAVLVALLPMKHTSEIGGELRSLAHYSSAVLLFLCIGYVCICRAGDTLSPSLVPDRKRAAKLFRTYKILGWLMIVLPFFAALVSGQWWKFFVETAGIVVFAIYWLVKSDELYQSGADLVAAEGRLTRNPPPSSLDKAAIDTLPVDGIGSLHVVP